MESLKKLLKKIRFFSYDRYVPYVNKSSYQKNNNVLSLMYGNLIIILWEKL